LCSLLQRRSATVPRILRGLQGFLDPSPGSIFQVRKFRPIHHSLSTAGCLGHCKRSLCAVPPCLRCRQRSETSGAIAVRDAAGNRVPNTRSGAGHPRVRGTRCENSKVCSVVYHPQISRRSLTKETHMCKTRNKAWIFALSLSLLLAAATVVSAQSDLGQPQNPAAKVTQGKLISLGTTSIQSPKTGTTTTPPPARSTPTQMIDEPALIRLMHQVNHNAPMPKSLETPVSAYNASIGYGGSKWTVPGLNNADSNSVNAGIDVEPPDQGLCAGNGQLLEAVNLVIAPYDQTGAPIGPPVSLNAFFGVGANALVGDFISDPRCYYDQGTGRWFVTVTDVEDIGFITAGRSFVLIAVSTDSNLLDPFNLFAIDTSDDGLFGTPADPGCLPSPYEGCFGDQPLIGADANGFYISTNEFGLVTPFFNGAQIYAIQKSCLVTLVCSPSPLVQFGNLTIASGIAASVHPAQSPVAVSPPGPNNGTELFLNTLNFNGTSDNRIGVWSLTNTATLNSSPNLFPQNLVLRVKPYEEPGYAQQKVGPYPQGMSYGDPEEALNPDDNRMQQVYYEGGKLYSAITSTVFDCTSFVDGVEWFIVTPSFKYGALRAVLSGNDYLAVKNENLIYPAVALDSAGKGAMTFTLTGPDFYPSAAFVKFNSKGPTGTVNVLAQGFAPDDGFTGYPYAPSPSNIQGAGRWGDYSAALADGGNLFIATEYISGGPRDFYVNWATSMSQSGSLNWCLYSKPPCRPADTGLCASSLSR